MGLEQSQFLTLKMFIYLEKNDLVSAIIKVVHKKLRMADIVQDFFLTTFHP